MFASSSPSLPSRPTAHDPALLIQGETLHLLPERALYWPRRATLFLADPHFGKPSAFHAAGIPIPPLVTQRDLDRLSLLLSTTKADHLVVLGDFFHTRHSQEEAVIAALHDWRTRHAHLHITLILGNHDLHAGPPPDALAIECQGEPFQLAPFVCRHIPLDNTPAGETEETSTAATGYHLAGHLHPMVRLVDRDGSQTRLPCFLFGPHQALLPAFGSFTGGSTLFPKRSENVYVIADNEVIPIHAPR